MENNNYLSSTFSFISSITQNGDYENKDDIINFLFNQYFLQVNQNKMKNLFNKMGLEDKYIFIDMTKVYFFDYNDGYYVKKFLNFDAYTSLHAEMIKKQ